MSLRRPAVFVSLGLLVACAPASPANVPAHDDGQERLDPALESELQPFESFNGMRGPALSINGLRFSGEKGSFQAMVSAYDQGRDIVFLLLPLEASPPPWLVACPRSKENPDQPEIQVALAGVGDLSHNVLWMEGTWTTSVGWKRYAPLETLRFEICGAAYQLENPYLERLREHARQVSANVQSNNAQSNR